jgi:hypothetical protein
MTTQNREVERCWKPFHPFLKIKLFIGGTKMTKEKGFNADLSWKGVMKWGGLSLFAAGAFLVIFILSVFISQQTLPLPAQEVLENPVVPTYLFLLAALGEFLLMPGALGLYFALKDVNKTLMFLATAALVLAVPMFLASRGLIISLSQISGRYLETPNETMKAAYLASAELAIETQNMYATMGLTLLSVASIMIGLVMLKGVFGKHIGYVAIIAGILSLFSPFGVMLGIPVIIPFIGLVLMAVWQIVVGAKLYKLGKDV